MVGQVVGLFSKPKNAEAVGIPKFSRPSLQVTIDGVVGDHNHYRTRTSKGPGRAVLLYTVDKLHELEMLGWPVRPGHIGENVLVEGIPYDAFDIGSDILVGHVRLRVQESATPCKKLATLPYVGENLKAFQQVLLGQRGWYCSVQHEGTVRMQDRVTIVAGSAVDTL